MSDRHALLIATYQYEDDGLCRLVALAQEAESMARVLSVPSGRDRDAEFLAQV